MEKEINIDEILERSYITLENNIRDGLIKQAIKEILTETLQMAADEAEIEIRHYSKFGGKYTSENIGQEVNIDDMNNYIGIDKESITSLINKIKF